MPDKMLDGSKDARDETSQYALEQLLAGKRGSEVIADLVSKGLDEASEQGVSKEGVARHVVAFAVEGHGHENGIEETLVIANEQDPAAAGDVFASEHPHPSVDPGPHPLLVELPGQDLRLADTA